MVTLLGFVSGCQFLVVYLVGGVPYLVGVFCCWFLLLGGGFDVVGGVPYLVALWLALF